MSDDVVIPPELVAAQRRAQEAFDAVGAWTEDEADSLSDRWAAVHEATAAAHDLRAPLMAEHGSWAVTRALHIAMQEGTK